MGLNRRLCRLLLLGLLALLGSLSIGTVIGAAQEATGAQEATATQEATGEQPTADETSGRPAAEESERGTAFRAVSGPQVEDVPGGALLVGAYGLVLLFLLVYVYRLFRLQSSTHAELKRLQEQLGARSSSPGHDTQGERARADKEGA